MKWGTSDRLTENNKNTYAHGHMNLKIGPHLWQVLIVPGKGGKVDYSGRTRAWLRQGKVKDSSYVLN